jgi:serine/threonine-protein kinase RsbW
MCITRSVQHPALRRHWSRLADPASVAALRSAVCDFAAGAGMTECLGDLRLAVSEAVTNSVVHAYREDRQRGQVSVTANLRDGCLEVVVADEGTGYRPRLDSPGLGAGLVLIAAVTHSFEIRDGDPAGAEVHMSFREDAGAALA